MVYGLGSSIITNLATFVSRTVFFRILGVTYLGVNGLLTNVLFMLSLAELGVGTAIGFSLYKPIAEGDTLKISALMSFYRKAYRVIGGVVTLLGLILMPFLPCIIKHSEKIPNLYLIYILFLAGSVVGYFVSYKNTLITADQIAYEVVPLRTGLTLLSTLGLICVLYLFRNYIVYLSLQIISVILTQVVVNRAITKKYPEVNFKSKERIPKEELDTIKLNVKAMFFHKIGDYCINGTDSIVISHFISIAMVGLYSNYLLLILTVNTYAMICFNSAQASFGNFLATETGEKRIETFETFNLLGFWVFSWVSICFYNLMTPVIQLWFGKQYTISFYVLIPVVLNYYFMGMRVPLGIVKTAGGVYDQDKYSPLAQSAVNLVFSVILVQKLGLAGVFWGTVISCAVPLVTRPYVVYKYIFQSSSAKYFALYAFYFIIFIANISVTSMICNKIITDSLWINLIGKSFACLLVPNAILYCIFRNQKKFRYITTNLLSPGVFRWKQKLAS